VQSTSQRSRRSWLAQLTRSSSAATPSAAAADEAQGECSSHRDDGDEPPTRPWRHYLFTLALSYCWKDEAAQPPLEHARASLIVGGGRGPKLGSSRGRERGDDDARLAVSLPTSHSL
jgi:hypothetical protein